jgi:hypothetical protein
MQAANLGKMLVSKIGIENDAIGNLSKAVAELVTSSFFRARNMQPLLNS